MVGFPFDRPAVKYPDSLNLGKLCKDDTALIFDLLEGAMSEQISVSFVLLVEQNILKLLLLLQEGDHIVQLFIFLLTILLQLACSTS